MNAPEERYRRIMKLRRRAQPAGYVAVGWLLGVVAFVAIVAAAEPSYALLLWFVMLVHGAATAGKAIAARNSSAAAYALLQCFAAVAIVAALLLTSLHPLVGPGVIAFAACYIVVAAPWAWRVWRRRITSFRAWECQACGYPLVGLGGSACPECGAPFDSDRVRAAAPRDFGEPWSSR